LIRLEGRSREEMMMLMIGSMMKMMSIVLFLFVLVDLAALHLVVVWIHLDQNWDLKKKMMMKKEEEEDQNCLKMKKMKE
jgi:cell division protein FtsL